MNQVRNLVRTQGSNQTWPQVRAQFGCRVTEGAWDLVQNRVYDRVPLQVCSQVYDQTLERIK